MRVETIWRTRQGCVGRSLGARVDALRRRAVTAAIATAMVACAVGCASGARAPSYDVSGETLRAWTADQFVSDSGDESARRRAARVLDMPQRDVNKVMQVGAAWVIVHEAPSIRSRPIGRLRTFDAVRVTAEADFIRIRRGPGEIVLSDMAEYVGEGEEISPTWVRIESGACTGWVPARSLADPVALATSSASIALARIEAIRGGATISLSEVEEHVPAGYMPRARNFGPKPDYETAGDVAGRLAAPWVLAEGADPFVPPKTALDLPAVGLTLADVDPALARSAEEARARTRDQGLPDRSSTNPGGLGLLGQFGAVDREQIRSAMMVADFMSIIFQEYRITVTEERLLGFEFLAACLAGRRMLPEAHPISCYVRHVGTRLAASSSMPYAAAGLDYVVIQDQVPDAMAMPGGPVLITTGMLELLGSEDELAAVLAHELAHIEERHAVAQAGQSGFAKWIACRTAVELFGNQDLGSIVERSSCFKHLSPEERQAIRGYVGAQVKQMMLQHYEWIGGYAVRDEVRRLIGGESWFSMYHEMLADFRGLSLMHAARYNPAAMESALQRTKAGAPSYGGATHAEGRIQAIRKAVRVLAPELPASSAPAAASDSGRDARPSSVHWMRLQQELAQLRQAT